MGISVPFFHTILAYMGLWLRHWENFFFILGTDYRTVVSRPQSSNAYAKRLLGASHWSQCCGSVIFWYGSGCGSSDPYIWLTEPDADPVEKKHKDPTEPDADSERWYNYKNKKSKRSHKTVEIKVFLTSFAWRWKAPEPHPYLWLTNPDGDPGGPKTYGSYGSGRGCGSGSATLASAPRSLLA
jgi:hypothetical protein